MNTASPYPTSHAPRAAIALLVSVAAALWPATALSEPPSVIYVAAADGPAVLATEPPDHIFGFHAVVYRNFATGASQRAAYDSTHRLRLVSVADHSSAAWTVTRNEPNGPRTDLYLWRPDQPFPPQPMPLSPAAANERSAPASQRPHGGSPLVEVVRIDPDRREALGLQTAFVPASQLARGREQSVIVWSSDDWSIKHVVPLERTVLPFAHAIQPTAYGGHWLPHFAYFDRQNGWRPGYSLDVLDTQQGVVHPINRFWTGTAKALLSSKEIGDVLLTDDGGRLRFYSIGGRSPDTGPRHRFLDAIDRSDYRGLKAAATGKRIILLFKYQDASSTLQVFSAGWPETDSLVREQTHETNATQFEMTDSPDRVLLVEPDGTISLFDLNTGSTSASVGK